MSKTQVSIITVNYYSEADIIESLKSILRKSQTTLFEYIIISNSPVEKHFEEKIKSLYPNTTVYQMPNNVGFSAACNKGAELSNGKYLFFLNPDTHFINDVISVLSKFHDRKPGFLISGPATYNHASKRIPSVKNHISFWFFICWLFPFINSFLKNSLKGKAFTVHQTMKIPVVNGHAMFIDAELHHLLGGFNEGYFMYWEENDICLNAYNNGYKTFFVDEARLIHSEGSSTSPYFLKMELEKHSSQKQFICTHYPKYVFLNRVIGIASYSWRVFASLLLNQDSLKNRQYKALLSWYINEY